MTDTVDTLKLDEGLAQLESARAWPEGLIASLRERLVSDDEQAAFQINPFAFAKQLGHDAEDGIQLLLHATRVGLVQIHWSLRCRGCGELVSNRGSLAQLDGEFYCGSCARCSAATLDDHVEVSFTVSPQIRPLRYHEPESLPNDDYFFRYRFSRNIVIRDIDRQLIEFLRDRQLILVWLEPGEPQTFELELPEAGWVVGSPRTMITVAGEPTTEQRELTLDYDGAAFTPRTELAPGPLRLTLRNLSDAPTRVFLYHTPIVTYFDYLPYLDGHRLLNEPEFRRCLGTEVVRPGTGIPIEDNTLLFTDMRGSTAIYDRIGDAAAFELVTEHFEAMARIVTLSGGVVVKTMGDAIMASFNNPRDAVDAGLRIIEDNDYTGPDGEVALLPKVGIHRGSCIVVNQNDMVDYFGQTVNIAARVQSVAGGNELCLSEVCLDDGEDGALATKLRRHGTFVRELRELKGVSEPVALYRLTITK